jgi:hypothetical protein
MKEAAKTFGQFFPAEKLDNYFDKNGLGGFSSTHLVTLAGMHY